MPMTRLLTADDLLNLGDGVRGLELIQGELWPSPPPVSALARIATSRWLCAQDSLDEGNHRDDHVVIAERIIGQTVPGREHGRITAHLAIILGTFALGSGLGQVYAGRTGYMLPRGRNKAFAPDLSFITADHVSDEDTMYLQDSPDLAVEIVPFDNEPGATERDVAAYLEAGVSSVWIVYPEERTVAVYRHDKILQVFTDTQEIDCSPELPGLIVPVATIFDGPCTAIG